MTEHERMSPEHRYRDETEYDERAAPAGRRRQADGAHREAAQGDLAAHGHAAVPSHGPARLGQELRPRWRRRRVQELQLRDGDLGRGAERIADAFDSMADRIEHRGRRMRRRGGARAQAGRAAESAGRMLETGADYLRAHDVEEMRLELETRVREKPIPALVAAAVAGFVFARIVR